MRFCVKVVVMFCTLLIGWALYGASATWTGIYTGDFPSEMTEGTMESELRGRVSGSDGVGASIIGMFYIHEESATMRLKAYDYIGNGWAHEERILTYACAHRKLPDPSTRFVKLQ